MPFDAKKYEDDQAFKDYVAAQKKEATDEAVAPLNRSITGLKKDVKKHKDMVAAFGDITPDVAKSNAEEVERFTQRGKDKETEAEKALRLAREKHDKDMADLRKTVDALVSDKKTLIVDDRLRAQAVKLKVKPEMVEAAMALIKPDVSVLDEDGTQVAKIGDQTIPEYMEEWAKTDVGKNFIQAPVNSGGGAGGSGGGGGGSNNVEKAFKRNEDGSKAKTWNLTEQIKLKKADPDEYQRLAKKHGIIEN